MTRIHKLEISFPVEVEVENQDLILLARAAKRICARYEGSNPTRVMWPFGQGAKMLANPLMLSDDEPIPFDDSVYNIEVAERERHPSDRDFKRNHTAWPAEEMFQDIAEFHRRFGLEYKGPPRALPLDLGVFRTGFIAEELSEYVSPKQEHHDRLVGLVKSYYEDMRHGVTLEKQFDALIDMVYVAMGTAYLQGFAFDEGWRRVHEANMKKVRAMDASHSTRNSTHDVVKPPGWTPPDLSDLVKP